MSSDSEFDPPSRKVRILTSGVVYYAYFAFGFSASIVGPALFDISERTGAEFSHVTWGFMIRNAAYCVCALLGSYAFSRMNRQLLFIASLFISGAAILMTPFVRQLYLYLLAEGVYGFFTAVVDVASNAVILEIWEAAPNAYMQGLHFCYSIGMFLAPLMVEPFLSYNPVLDLNSTDPEKDPLPSKESRIEIPYSIGATSLFVAASVLLLLHLKVPYRDPKRCVSQKNGLTSGENNNASDVGISVSDTLSLIEAESDKRYTYIVILFGSLILCFYSGVEATTINFFPKFAVSLELGLTKSDAAFMTSVMAAAYSLCRGISIFLAMKVRPRPMLYGCMVLLVMGNVLLLIFANTSKPMLWFALIVLGVGQSCVIPAVYSLCEERINVTNAACSLFILSTCLNVIITPAILAAFVDKTPLVLVYLNGAGLAICVVLFAALHYTDMRRAVVKQNRVLGFDDRS